MRGTERQEKGRTREKTESERKIEDTSIDWCGTRTKRIEMVGTATNSVCLSWIWPGCMCGVFRTIYVQTRPIRTCMPTVILFTCATKC